MSKPSRNAAAQLPVSAHPAFPVIVALWFAALLGIGSMVLPVAMFERFTLASGLADVLAAAQPPLGATARIVVALIAAAIGTLVGLFVARQVSAAQAVRSIDLQAAALPAGDETGAPFVKRPIFAHEELGEGGLDADPDADAFPEQVSFRSGRRRALAATENDGPRDFNSFAPLPGQGPDSASEPLDLIAFAEPAPATEPAQTYTHGGPSNASEHSESPPSFESESEFTEEVPESAPAVPLTERALSELGMVELVERFALALQRHREAAVEPTSASKPDAALSAQLAAEEFTAFADDRASQFPAIPAALQPVDFAEEWADEAEADQALPELNRTDAFALHRKPAARGIDAADERDLAPEWDEDDEADAVAEGAYPSLLAMKASFGAPRAPVRFDDDFESEVGDEPAADRPGEPARDAFAAPRPSSARRFAEPAATESALRDALEKLQKLSGAA